MSETLAIVLAVCSAIITISSAATAVIMWISKARAPSVKMNERVTNIENRLVKIEQHLDNDNQRLKEQEEANRITQQSLLAIMNYLINGGEADKAKLVATRDRLQEYLIGK